MHDITAESGERIISSLQRLLEGIPNATRAALDASLKMGLDKAKQTVPVRTGALQRSIHHEIKSAQQGELVAGDYNVDYAKLVEFGTKNRTARPYMKPSAEITNKELPKRLSEEVGKLLRYIERRWL